MRVQRKPQSQSQTRRVIIEVRATALHPRLHRTEGFH